MDMIIRYGTMRENVINLTAVLPNGEVIKTRQRAKLSLKAHMHLICDTLQG